LRNSESQKAVRPAFKLREEPCDDSVSDRCAVNIAPLQLSEEIARVHGFLSFAKFSESGMAAELVKISIEPSHAIHLPLF
jgi:hypothetical protein